MAGTLTGGLRDRMILHSFYLAIETQLTTNGWFDADREHAPIVMIDAYPNEEEPAINTLAISSGDLFTRRAEMGSRATTQQTFMYADFFAESDALSRHVVGDIVAFLNSNPVVAVRDYSAVDDPLDFYAFVEDGSVEVARPDNVNLAWQKHWGIVSWAVEDER